jgi:transcriptional regulator with XRE-family HTH domain
VTGRDVREARKQKRWTQTDLAEKLGVTQAYVSLLESDQRDLPRRLQPKLVTLLDLPASDLPMTGTAAPLPEERVASALASLGYPGFAHLAHARKLNPAELLDRTLRRPHVEARIAEALPWVVVHYPHLDWAWLVSQAKQHDFQNRLGFVVTVARELADRSGDTSTAQVFRAWEDVLQRSRLQKEDSFAGDRLTDAERRWLRTNRSVEAAHWNMLSNCCRSLKTDQACSTKIDQG